jgi:hypothetical protein
MAVAAAAAALCVGHAAAQSEVFETRLATVPIDARSQASITGEGDAMATLDGRRLTITGSFTGLRGSARTAHLHLSAVTGVRGPAIYDLEVTAATEGTIHASLELSPRHVEALRSGLLYIQIDGEDTPEGNLWGWLLP